MLWNVDIFNEVDRLRREMNNLFSDSGRTTTNTYPLLNAYENEDEIAVTAELPGLTKDDVNITFSEGVLTLSGNQRTTAKMKEMTAIRKERSDGEFEKTLQIPVKIKQDIISASFIDGVLTITLPKAEEAKPKTITIEAN